MNSENQAIDKIKDPILKNSCDSDNHDMNAPQADPEYATLTQLNTEASVRAETDFSIYNHFRKTKEKHTEQISNLTINKADKIYVDTKHDLKQDKLIAGGNINITADNVISAAGGSGDVSKGYVDEQNALKQNITDNTLNTTDKTVPGAINELLTDVNLKQNITDNSLNTTSKIVVGAINELVTNKQNITDNTLKTTDKTVPGAINELEEDKADTTYVNTQIATKQNIVDNALTTSDKTVVAAINELNIIKTDFIYVDGQLENKQLKTDNSLATTSKTVVGAINELYSGLRVQSYYWQVVQITGAGTRNVTVVEGLQPNTTYRIRYTWSNNKNASYCYKEYYHMKNTTVDIERYIHSSVIGLLPNVLALANTGNTGFRIYPAIGVQNTEGYINSVEMRINLFS